MFTTNDGAVSLQHSVVLFAQFDDRALLTPRMKFDLVHRRSFVTIDKFLKMLKTVIRYTDGDYFALRLEFLEC